MGTEFFIATGVFPAELLAYICTKFQWRPALQIGQDSSVYILDIILG